MNKVITIARQFGSGGRELARYLAEELSFDYYDKEIIKELSKRTSLSENYIDGISEERPTASFALSFARSFYTYEDPNMSIQQSIFEEQVKLLKEFAEKSSCVIVGRSADYLLSDYKPIRIFVYADMDSRIKRCMARKRPEEVDMDERAMEKQINKIDKNRAKFYEFNSGNKWGEAENYDLCINTSGRDLKDLAKKIAKFFID